MAQWDHSNSVKCVLVSCKVKWDHSSVHWDQYSYGKCLVVYCMVQWNHYIHDVKYGRNLFHIQWDNSSLNKCVVVF